MWREERRSPSKQHLFSVGLLLSALLVASTFAVAAGNNASTLKDTTKSPTVPYAGTASVVDRSNDPVPTPDPASTVYVASFIESDLATLKRELHFSILLPQYLPEGVRLTSVRKIVDLGPETGPGVELRYEGYGVGWFTIIETSPVQPPALSIDSRKVIQEIDINGNNGVLYDPGGPQALPIANRSILQWIDANLMLEMRGSNFDWSDLIQVARSIR